MKTLFRALVCFALPLTACSSDVIKVSSPDSSIRFELRIIDDQAAYSVYFGNTPVISESVLRLTYDEDIGSPKKYRFDNPDYARGVENYELVVGKTSHVNDSFNEVAIPIHETNHDGRYVTLRVRLFDDGLAFRYEFPVQSGDRQLVLTDENTSFRFTRNPKILALFLPNYTTSHEGSYSHILWSEVREDTLIDMPALFEFPGHVYMAVTEAALTGYAGMYLTKHNGILRSRLAPMPGNEKIKVIADLPHKSPWRVLMISDRIGDLIESNLITNLNEKCKIEDVSWIKAGKTTWPWWNGNITPGSELVAGNNFETQKYYIDFCARYGLEYHSVVEYGGHEWYVSDGKDFGPGPGTDVTKPVPGLDPDTGGDLA